MITLGHNSSALFFDGENTVGYEQERLDKIKSSSAFPKDAIEKIKEQYDIKDSYLFVSHWYDSFDLKTVDYSKHVDNIFLEKLVNDFNLTYIPLSEDFTHHDAHAYSSLSFLLNFMNKEKTKLLVGDKIHFLVVDGFGNRQEVVSLYSLNKKDLFVKNNNLKKIASFGGYFKSLGLMYQNATSYCGMKENQDEYKFLGYESHITSVLNSTDLLNLDTLLDDRIRDIFDNMFVEYRYCVVESFINVGDLRLVKKYWYEIFDSILSNIGIKNDKNFVSRVIIGYSIQRIIEDILLKIVKMYDIKNLCVSGGVFYNVKLNNRLLNSVPGIFSAMPLAGDQGAAIGMYKKYVGDFYFKNMCFGIRDEFDYSLLKQVDFKDKIFVTKNRHDVVEKIAELLKQDNIVNFVEGNMEFGPRALCHTSTLSLPSSTNVDYINTLNKRNTVMPMAPVMLQDFVHTFFDTKTYDRIIGSDMFMIVTLNYKEFDEKYNGVSHKYPKLDVYSGRPQVVSSGDNKIVKNVLENLSDYTKCLVNTSFNVHGNPILYDYKSIFEDFVFQCNQAVENNIKIPYLVLYV